MLCSVIFGITLKSHRCNRNHYYVTELISMPVGNINSCWHHSWGCNQSVCFASCCSPSPIPTILNPTLQPSPCSSWKGEGLSEHNGTCRNASTRLSLTTVGTISWQHGRKWRNKAFGRSQERAAGPLICLERFWFSWHSDSWYIKLFNSVVSMAAWIHLVPVIYD